MTSVPEIVEMLVGALQRPEQRHELVREFQEVVLNEPERSAQGYEWDVLTDLATKMEFYVADLHHRKEHRSYYGDERLREEILSSLRELVEAGVITSEVMRRAASA